MGIYNTLYNRRRSFMTDLTRFRGKVGVLQALEYFIAQLMRLIRSLSFMNSFISCVLMQRNLQYSKRGIGILNESIL